MTVLPDRPVPRQAAGAPACIASRPLCAWWPKTSRRKGRTGRSARGDRRVQHNPRPHRVGAMEHFLVEVETVRQLRIVD